MSQHDDLPSKEELAQRDGYYPRDVDEFHKEANVLAGHDPAEVTPQQPENLGARRLTVFLIITVVGLLAMAVAMGLIAVPDCENPPYNWMPCVPNF